MLPVGFNPRGRKPDRFSDVTGMGSRLLASVVGWVMVVTAGAVAAASPSAHTQQMEALGYQRFEGAWRTAQEISLIKQAKAVTAAEVAARQQLEQLRRELDKPDRAEQAAAAIREIDDPLAVSALVKAVTTEIVPRVRLLYVEALGKIQTPAAVDALLTLAIDHADREVRWQATEQLTKAHAAQVVPPLVAVLNCPDNTKINRAAAVLGRVGNWSAIEPLIHALVTRHTVVTDPGSGGQTSATFSPSGGGLALGGGPKTRTVLAKNHQVLEALVGLTDVNYGWDRDAWRTWLLGQRLPPETDLRRSN